MTSIEPLKSLYVTLEKDDTSPQIVHYRGQVLRLANVIRRYDIKFARIESGMIYFVDDFQCYSVNYYQHDSGRISYLPENILNNPFRYLKDPCDYIQAISKEIIKGDYEELQVYSGTDFCYKESKENL